jgi:hypothetical protein
MKDDLAATVPKKAAFCDVSIVIAVVPAVDMVKPPVPEARVVADDPFELPRNTVLIPAPLPIFSVADVVSPVPEI